MKKFFKKWRIWLLQFGIIFICSYCIIKTDAFQEMISPNKYWTIKVEELKNKIKADRMKIHCLRLKIEKERAVKPFEIKEIKIKACSSQDVEENLAKLKKEKEEKLQLLKKDLAERKQMCSLREVELKQAQEKLRQT